MRAWAGSGSRDTEISIAHYLPTLDAHPSPKPPSLLWGRGVGGEGPGLAASLGPGDRRRPKAAYIPPIGLPSISEDCLIHDILDIFHFPPFFT